LVFQALEEKVTTDINAGPQIQAENPPFYLFHTAADYHAYFPADPTPLAGVPAQTAYNANGTPLHSAVWEVTIDGKQNLNFQNTITHELGHWMDFLYQVKTGAVRASNSQVFADELANDWYNINVKPSCGAGGVFSSFKDSNGNYFCTNNGAGNALVATYSQLAACANPGNPSTCNQAVLTSGTAYKAIFGLNKEIWAETVAVDNGFFEGGIMSPDNYYANNEFQCTKTLVTYLITNGVLPLVNQYPHQAAPARACPAN